MAFVFCQHLSPQHKSSLPEIVSRATKLPVREIAHGMEVKPDHLFVLPPGHNLTVLHGVFCLTPYGERDSHRHLPVDHFFRSLAENVGPAAIAVILSGTGSDGTLGLREIKAAGGITFVQTSETARYDGMPSSAAPDTVDFRLPPQRIAEELAHIARIGGTSLIRDLPEETSSQPTDDLQKIFLLLRRTTGVDFSLYKQTTVSRRIARRMLLHKIDSLKRYAKYVQQTPGEVGALFDELLINVTGFFRDPESFEALKEIVFSRILKSRDEESPLRIWVPACSTGEEAYSIAMVLLEYLDEHDGRPSIQIFATDVSESAVQRARIARYPENIAADVSPSRLGRFFHKVEGGYQISKAIRDMCIVARQNVVRDPPFSGLDLISCRNLLIYLGPQLQKRALPTFHYALKPNGFLMLSSSETIGGFSELFSVADSKHKIYSRKPIAASLPPRLGPSDEGQWRGRAESLSEPARPRGLSLEQEADRIVLGDYSPAGFLIDQHMNIHHFRGQTGRFLEPAPGQASLNLLKMARHGLGLDIRSAVHAAKRDNVAVRKEGVRLKHNGDTIVINLRVIPLAGAAGEEGYFLVLFEEPPAPREPRPDESLPQPGKPASNRELEEALNELAQTKDSLRTIIEQHESANEELRAANEEIESSNEELQSTNEELETAKEELQSANEELTTVNEELENRNTELTQIINDYNNLLASIEMPVVIVDTESHVRMFTPAAAEAFNLIPADEDRPISSLKLAAEIDGLERKVTEVIATGRPQDEEVQLPDGRWYALRLRPYRTAEKKPGGAVLVLLDIHQRKLAEARMIEQERLDAAMSYAQSVVAAVREPLVVLDEELRVISANPAFYRTFHVQPGPTERMRLYALGDNQWDIPELRKLLEEIIPRDTTFDDYVVEHEFPTVGRKRILLNARRIDQPDGRPHLILLAMEDVTNG